MLSKNLKSKLCVATLLLIPSVAKADLYHYNNLLIGDRALGLGGAFTAIADDASGVYYNPAGLGFALNNDISGSANARFSKETIFKEVVPGTDYAEKSEGSVAPFVGGLQKLDNVAKGLVFAFALYNTNNELINQNDQIRLVGNTGLVEVFFDRKVQYKSEDFNVGLGLGYRMSNNVSVGLSATMVSMYELSQDYQYSGSLGQITGGNYTFTVQTGNSRNELSASGMELGMGVQVNLMDGLVVGATVKGGSIVSQTYTIDNNSTATVYDSSVSDLTNCSSSDVCNNLFSSLQEGTNGKLTFSDADALSNSITTSQVEVDDVLSDSLPVKARLGLAYFFSPQLIFSFDTAYAGESKSEEEYGVYDKESVIDYHFGMEYYASPSMPVRLGVFTNNDTRPEVEVDGQTKIDYTGVSVFTSWVQPNSQLGIGVTYQTGTGKAIKRDTAEGATPEIQDVESSSTVYALSAAHSF